MPHIDENALDTLFRKARTHNGWQDRPVGDGQLRALYDVMKWGPTSANCSPLRIIFLRTKEAKEKVLPAMSDANREKTRLAPVTAILAYDTEVKLQEQGLSPASSVPSLTIEAGPKYFDGAATKVADAVTAVGAAIQQRDAAPYASN